MTEISRIQDQLRRAVNGEAWHGPALMELLNEVPVDVAPARPLEHAHSIWEIVLHITAWFEIVTNRVKGKAVEPTHEQDWPPVQDVSEAAWQEAISTLKQSHQHLLQALGHFQDEQLTKIVPGKNYNYYFMLHGAIQHVLYHAGQVAVLKKSSR